MCRTDPANRPSRALEWYWFGAYNRTGPYLSEVLVNPRGVNHGKTIGRFNRRITGENSASVFIYVEANVYYIHFAVQRESKDQVIVCSFRSDKLQGRICRGRVLCGKFTSCHPFTHLQHRIFKASVVDVDFLYQISHFPD